MKIERRFTTAGKDSYDGIDFRKAVSEIKNPDGSIVFRLEDIEVPASWSQVATDILAQKYFRKAGVPKALKRFEEETVPSWLWRSVADEAALAGGELGWPRGELVAVPDDLRGAADGALDLGLGEARVVEAAGQGQVVEEALVGPEGRVLEDEAGEAVELELLGPAHRRQVPAPEEDRAPVGDGDAGRGLEEARLPRARASHEDARFAVGQGEGDVLEDLVARPRRGDAPKLDDRRVFHG